MLKVKNIQKNSIAEELGLEVGDNIISFDGNKVVDVLDYLYYNAREKFTMQVFDDKGNLCDFEVEKGEEETLGLTFQDDGLKIKLCQNNCIFCFVAQMPKGMRKSLYVKDDDYRQSFMYGNFVTLTNLTDEEVDRIIRLNLSPLYVSVHTMDMDLRRKMLRNDNAGKLEIYLEKFKRAGIKVNAQIVLCRGINDGDSLIKTLDKLYKLYPCVDNVAIVPCGMTKFRQNLTTIEDIDEFYSLEIIAKIRALNKAYGINFVTLADEFYFRAGIPVEEYEFYANFPQLENGVGMTAKFLKEIEDCITPCENNSHALVISGTSAKEFLEQVTDKICQSCKGLKVTVLPIVNDYFGDTINCSGLLTGKDIVNQVKNSGISYDFLLINSSLLKNGEDLFLDDLTLGEFSKLLGEVRVTDGSGESFVYNLTSKKV